MTLAGPLECVFKNTIPSSLVMQPTINHLLFKFYVGDAVHQQSPNTIRTLINCDLMSYGIELAAAARPAGPDPTMAPYNGYAPKGAPP
ncbi:MAG: hypothetical protein Ct9H300mP13_2350 [Gammaproteobacteria bacterium]|nr:MAG: hypothetical protein Ct9H300mP13_2350 [Gammaproteobacteria bacterium]